MIGMFLLNAGWALNAQEVNVKGEGEPFTHYWSVGTCAGRANEGLRTSW